MTTEQLAKGVKLQEQIEGLQTQIAECKNLLRFGGGNVEVALRTNTYIAKVRIADGKAEEFVNCLVGDLENALQAARQALAAL